jgi:hypothetical protein
MANQTVEVHRAKPAALESGYLYWIICFERISLFECTDFISGRIEKWNVHKNPILDTRSYTMAAQSALE